MEINKVKDIQFNKKKTLKIFGNITHLERPVVMGIVNVNDDSFYEGSRSNCTSVNLNHIENMVSEGAAIIDIGAASTRPGAELITFQEEKERLNELLVRLRIAYPRLILSLDTYNSNTAKWAVEVHNINIINDISMGLFDDQMFSTVAKLKVPYVLMHNRGIPSEMNQKAQYHHLMKEVLSEISEKAYHLREMGLSDMIIDPGFGFAKNITQNYELLKQLDFFHLFGHPLMIGISRKSMVYKLLESNASESLNGSSILHTIALMKGADILRVHDVKEAMECIKICEQMEQ